MLPGNTEQSCLHVLVVLEKWRMTDGERGLLPLLKNFLSAILISKTLHMFYYTLKRCRNIQNIGS